MTQPIPMDHRAQMQRALRTKLVDQVFQMETACIDLLAATYNQLHTATCFSDVLCWATLVASKRLGPNSTVADALEYYDSLDNECTSCPYSNDCTALLINQ